MQSVDNRKMTDSNLKCNDDKQINIQTTNCGLCLCSRKDFITSHPFLGNMPEIQKGYKHKETHEM